jgi:SHS2 domain-containing protein
MYEIFEHTADLGLRVKATDLDTLFVEAARGLLSVIVENLDEVRPVEQINFHIEGQDRQYLFFDWLNEILYTFDTKHLILSRFDVKVGEAGLDAVAWGEALDTDRHQLDHEVKAITYHALKVIKQQDGWLAEVIVDI